ncbi:MAG TPA: thioredoxin domain-containing protein [Micromonosporaceae bacterium]
MSGSSTMSGNGASRAGGSASRAGGSAAVPTGTTNGTGDDGTAETPARRARREAWNRDLRLKRKHNTILISSLLGLAAIIAVLIGFGIYESKQKPAVALPAHLSRNDEGLAVGGSGPVVVDVYVDYQCTGCRAFQDATAATLQDMMASNEIRLVYHPIATLNALSTSHYSARAANAAACAANLGMFAQFNKALFAAQPKVHTAGLTDDQIIQLAGDAGIIDPRFAQCVRQHTYLGWINRVTTASAGYRVNAVPIVLVNGATFVPTGITPDPEQLTAAVTRAEEASAKPTAGK